MNYEYGVRTDWKFNEDGTDDILLIGKQLAEADLVALFAAQLNGRSYTVLRRRVLPVGPLQASGQWEEFGKEHHFIVEQVAVPGHPNDTFAVIRYNIDPESRVEKSIDLRNQSRTVLLLNWPRFRTQDLI